MPKKFFEDYGAVIGDEAHLFKVRITNKDNDKTN